MDRLAIDGGDGATLTLDLHPRLTVVGGIGQAERDSLLGELVGAMGGSRPGVHVEVTTREGRQLAAFRPTVGRAAVVDVTAARDVSDQLRGPDGRLDLLAPFGLDVAGARAVMRFGAADLAVAGHRDEVVDRLAAADQDRLWRAAEQLARSEGELTAEAEAVGSAPEDAELIEEVENRHARLEAAAERFDAVRRGTFVIGGTSGVLTLPTVVALGAIGLGFAAVAVLGTIASVVSWRQMVAAQRAEERVLSEAGAQSYLGFQLQRVNGLLGDDDQRHRLMSAAEDRRQAASTWQALAGEVPVGWALAHRAKIESAARLRRDVDALGTLSASGPDVSHDESDALSRALTGRLAELAELGGEGLPLVLDDPLRDVEPSLKPLLLELLSHTAGAPQIVFLTDDEDVASWARLEALTGEVALVEPALDNA